MSCFLSMWERKWLFKKKKKNHLPGCAVPVIFCEKECPWDGAVIIMLYTKTVFKEGMEPSRIDLLWREAKKAIWGKDKASTLLSIAMFYSSFLALEDVRYFNVVIPAKLSLPTKQAWPQHQQVLTKRPPPHWERNPLILSLLIFLSFRRFAQALGNSPVVKIIIIIKNLHKCVQVRVAALQFWCVQKVMQIPYEYVRY